MFYLVPKVFNKDINIYLIGKTKFDSKICKVLTLILSDVIGDPLDTIASGPTVHPPGHSEAEAVLRKYDLLRKLPPGLELKRDRPANEVFKNISNVVIGNNSLVLTKALNQFEKV